MSPAPSTRPSIKILFSSFYRTGARTWSVRFHLDQAAAPADASHWAALALAIRNDLKGCFTSGCTIIGSVGYAAGSEVPVWSESVSVPGTLVGGTPVPGDCAAMLRWSTTQRTSKNHPIYLFNYFHMPNWSGSGNSDLLWSTQQTALNNFAVKFASGGAGFSDGTVTYHRAGPYGAVGQIGKCDTYIRHRDFA